MKNTMRLFTVATIVVAAAMSFAQGGGGMRMMGGPGGGSMTMLLNREDVKKEIKLTAEQSGKLEDARNAMMEEMRNRFQNGGGGGGGGDMEEMRKAAMEMMKKSEKDSLAILDDTQKKRLKELWIQRTGNRVVLNEEVQKDLAMTDEQKTQIKKLMDAQEQANQEIRQKMMNGEMDRSEIRPLMEKNNKALDAELGKIITTAQSEKLKMMGGTPFKFEDEG